MPLSNNARIFYACQAVALEPLNSVTATGVTTLSTVNPTNSNAKHSQGVQILHGVQSVGINTTFNLEQVFELGQIHIYENIEGVPDIEVTLEKVLDGYPLMYHVASTAVQADNSLTTPAAKAALVARTKQRCNAILGIYSDTVSHIGDGNTATNDTVEVLMSGMYISSIGYTIPVDGNATESLTLVGNHKQWNLTPSKFNPTLARQLTSGNAPAAPFEDGPGNFNSTAFRGGVQRRENVALNKSILPQSINGVRQNTSPGNAWSTTLNVTGVPLVHLQNVNISCSLNRESVQELGRKAPYTRYANFPVEVTCEIEAITTSGDFVQALEEGLKANPPGDPNGQFNVGQANYGNNTKNERIRIVLHDGTIIDLGSKNRLSSINYTGGDAGGGNATVTYSYSTYNSLSVLHPNDPANVAATDFGGFFYNGQ
jgi:hypothetical protein